MTMRMTIAAVVLVAYASMAAPTLAQAPSGGQDFNQDPGGLYARLAAGIAFGRSMDQDLAFSPAASDRIDCPTVVGADCPDPTINLPFSQSVDIDPGATFGFALGFDYGNNFRTELEYRYLEGEIESVTLQNENFANIPALRSGGLQTHALIANVAYDFAPQATISPFVSVGLGGVWADGPANTLRSEIESDSAFALQARAGVAWRINDTTRMTFDYSFLASRDLRYGPEEFDPADDSLVPQVDGAGLRASSIQIGVEKRF